MVHPGRIAATAKHPSESLAPGQGLTLTYSGDACEPPACECSDTVYLTVMHAEIHIQGPTTPAGGTLLGVGQLAAMTFTQTPATYDCGDLSLAWNDDPETRKVRLYDSLEKTTEYTSALVWNAGNSPPPVYVEAVAPSETLGDVEFTLTWTCADTDPTTTIATGRTTQVQVDLDIWNGQYVDGAQELDEVKEDNPGAFTVANLNDTDNNGHPDVEDTVVNGTPPNGRPEVDLMKLLLRKPRPDLGDSVTLSVTGPVKLWEKSIKETEVELSSGIVQFATSQLEKTLWVEVITPSQSLRDVTLELSYQGFTDTVKATAIWATRARFVNSGPRLDPAPPYNTLYPNMDDAQINTFISENGDAFGHGTWTRFIERTGNRELSEYLVGPGGIGDELGVVFDVTRQASWRDCDLTDGTLTPTDDPQDMTTSDEAPDDDPNTLDEDDTPKENFIYCFDAPSSKRQATCDFRIARESFREFVRVRFDGAPFPHENRQVEGSRCSGHCLWHHLMYLRRSATGVFADDLATASASAPQKTGTGDGAMSDPATSASTITEGWTVTFSAAESSWTVVGTKSGTQETKATTGAAYTSDDGQISFTITAGSIPFADGDKFKFSTFRSSRKAIDIDTGPTDIEGDP